MQVRRGNRSGNLIGEVRLAESGSNTAVFRSSWTACLSQARRRRTWSSWEAIACSRGEHRQERPLLEPAVSRLAANRRDPLSQTGTNTWRLRFHRLQVLSSDQLGTLRSPPLSHCRGAIRADHPILSDLFLSIIFSRTTQPKYKMAKYSGAGLPLRHFPKQWKMMERPSTAWVPTTIDCIGASTCCPFAKSRCSSLWIT